MARRKKGNKIDGWINFHKPVGMTSTQAVGKIRYALQAQKAGHGGTLDPLASGVLPIALGEATKTVNFIQDAMKIYNFTVTWGEQRSTDDAEGEAIQTSDKRPAIEDITALLPEFIGDIQQIPPQFSAIKVDGERAYDIARDGEHVEIKSREVYIEELTILTAEENSRSEPASLRQSETKFRALCGKGTYIRSLARDMGAKLGCFGYISALERAEVGAMNLNSAISLDIIEEMIDNPTQERDLSGILLPLQTPLDDIPVLALKEKEWLALKNGNAISFLAKPDLTRMEQIGIDWKSDDYFTALATFEGKAIAMVETYGAKIQPVRVFNL